MSSLSIFSNSGLFKELEVDMLSSNETEPVTDLLGETSLLLKAPTMLLGAVKTGPLLLGERSVAIVSIESKIPETEVSLYGTKTLDFELHEPGKTFSEMP